MITLAGRAPPDHPCYADHFPGDPLVPGALLLAWIEAALIEHAPGCRLAAIEQCKFRAPLRPGQHYRIDIEGTPAPDATLTLRCHSEAGEHLAARLTLVAAEAR